MALDLESRSALVGQIAAGSNAVPTGYTTGAGSLVLTGIAYAAHLSVINQSTSGLYVNYAHSDAAEAPTSDNLFVPPGTDTTTGFSAVTCDDIKVGSTVYVRSASGSTIGSGTITVFVW